MATTKTTARRTTRKNSTRKPRKVAKVVPAETATIDSEYDSQWHAKLEAYVTLKQAGVEIPDEIRIPVEKWVAEQNEKTEAANKVAVKVAAKVAKEDEKAPKWVRNGYPASFSLRLRRQDKKDRIELAPRGQRGDMFPLEDGDEKDQILVQSVGTGLIEIIPNSEAQRIAEHQTTNIQPGVTTLSMLRNEKDEPIQDLIVETEWNQQGVVVGQINPHAGKRDPLGGIVRPNEAERVRSFVPTGGNPAIVSQGYLQGPQGQQLTPDATAKISDDLARVKGLQGRPEDVLGLTVSVSPAQKA